VYRQVDIPFPSSSMIERTRMYRTSKVYITKITYCYTTICICTDPCSSLAVTVDGNRHPGILGSDYLINLNHKNYLGNVKDAQRKWYLFAFSSSKGTNLIPSDPQSAMLSTPPPTRAK
jgi:hypothetical protein